MAKFIPFALAYIMFTLGLTLQFRDFLNIQQHPKAFGIGLINQLVLVPILFLVSVLLLSPSPAMAFGLMLIGFCPGGVTSNLFSRMVGGNVALSIALTGAVSLLSVLTLPVLTAMAYQFCFHETMPSVSIVGLGVKLFLLTAVPVLLGMLLRRARPEFIERHQNLFAKTATGAFVLILLLTMYVQHQTLVRVFAEIGFILPMICAVLLVVSITVARWLNLSVQDVDTIAIESSVQNGSVGLAVATLIATGDALPEFALPALLYGLLMNVTVIPFVLWKQQSQRATTH